MHTTHASQASGVPVPHVGGFHVVTLNTLRCWPMHATWVSVCCCFVCIYKSNNVQREDSTPGM
jgi:hypothetical protein